MPALKNARHERFAQELAKGQSADAAYAAAGYAPDRKNAARLTTNDGVRTRLSELQGKAAAKAVITLESHLADLEVLRDKAASAKQYSAAITAEIARGKASGVHVEKSESLVTTRELPASVDEFV
jgi:phage terminase small subunit